MSPKAKDHGGQCSSLGVPGLHLHDLRHTGVSLADLKARMGHDSARAAMIYQHATTAADHKIADALTRRIDGAQGTAATRPEEAPADGETAV